MPCVYALYSSENPEEIKYVGRSQFDSPQKRLSTHIQEANQGKSNTYKCKWIRHVLTSGFKVEVITLETNLSWDESATKEMEYISHYKSLGHKLTNLTLGGDGALGMVHTDDTRYKMRIGHLGRKHSPEAIENMKQARKFTSAETRAKLSAWQKGKPKSEEHKQKMRKPKSPEHVEKMRQINLGRQFSEEHKRKISIAGKGRIVSKETREKLSKAKKGFKHTPEAIEKNRQAHLGKKASLETRMKQSAARKGKKRTPLSAETKKKISDTLILRNKRLRENRTSPIVGGE